MKGTDYYSFMDPVFIITSAESQTYDVRAVGLEVLSHQRIFSALKKEIKQNINLYMSLTENWDGYGAIPPSKRSVDNSLAFMDIVDIYKFPLSHFDYNFPTTNGTIEFEFKLHNKEVSLEIGKNKILLVIYNCDKLEKVVEEVLTDEKRASKYKGILQEIFS